MFIAIVFAELAILFVSYFVFVFAMAAWSVVEPLDWGPYRSLLADVRIEAPFVLTGLFWYGMVVLTLNGLMFVLMS